MPSKPSDWVNLIASILAACAGAILTVLKIFGV
nr:MAG: hypothetical protein [Microviridae sp.]